MGSRFRGNDGVLSVVSTANLRSTPLPWFSCPALLGRTHGTRSRLMLLTHNSPLVPPMRAGFCGKRPLACLSDAQRREFKGPRETRAQQGSWRAAPTGTSGVVSFTYFSCRHKKSESPQQGAKPKVEKYRAKKPCSTTSAPIPSFPRRREPMSQSPANHGSRLSPG